MRGLHVMRYKYSNMEIDIVSDETHYTISVENYKNRLSKQSNSFDDACSVAENVVDMFNKVPRALLKYFKNDNDFIVSKDETTGLYGIRYTSLGVDWSKPYMTVARGLVIDEIGNIITTPYSKFFNYKQYTPETKPEYLTDEFVNYHCDYNPEVESYDVLEKLDGSMIAVSSYNGELLFSSTRKPNSTFSDKAKEWVKNNLTDEKINNMISEVENGATLIFEYIGPENKIVVNYDREELVLTGAVVMHGGYLMTYLYESLVKVANDIGVRVVRLLGNQSDYTPNKLLEIGKEEKGIEGFVLRFGTSGKQIKIKTEEYIEKHRSATLFFGDVNTRFKNLMIIQMIEDETFDDVMADMIQRGYPDISKHMQRVYDLYIDVEEELTQAYATVRYSGILHENEKGQLRFESTFSKSDYFRNFKGKFGLKQALIVLFSEQSDGTYLSKGSERVKEAIKKHILRELKEIKEG